MGGGFLPPCHWKGPKSAPAAVCQETLWVALRHSWTGLCSLSPLEISGGLLFGGCSGQRWVSLPFLLSSPGASRNTVGRIPGLLACEAPHACPAFSPSGSASLTQALSSTCPSRSPPGSSPRKPTPLCVPRALGFPGHHTCPRVLLRLSLSMSVVSLLCSRCLSPTHTHAQDSTCQHQWQKAWPRLRRRRQFLRQL